MKALLLTLLAVMLSGCSIRSSSYRQTSEQSNSHSRTPPPVRVRLPSTHEQLVFEYRVEGGNAILDSDKVRLVFPGLSRGQRNAFAFKAGAIAIQVAGEGRSETTVSCRRNFSTARFQARYEHGTNTIDFCGRTVLLSEAARVITTGNDRIELSDGKRDVLIAGK